MKKATGVLLAVFFAYFSTCTQAVFAEDSVSPPEVLELKIDNPIKGTINKDDNAAEEGQSESTKPLAGRVWTFVKGEPVQNSVIAGMWCYHTSKKRKEYQENNKMFSLQYKGVSAGTFENSHHWQTYYIGFARKIYKKQITENISVDVQYKAGLMHGYKDKYPNIDGTTPFILPMFGLDYKDIGADFWIIPSSRPIFAVNTRINFPEALNKKLEFKKKKKEVQAM